MEQLLKRSFVPQVLLVPGEDCSELRKHALLSNTVVGPNHTPLRVCTMLNAQATNVPTNSQIADTTPLDIDSLVRETRKSSPDFAVSVVENIVAETLNPARAQPFETFGHPVACILAVSSTNPSPISSLTQLYQQSYLECPATMGPDFLRCVWYVNDGNNPTSEDFATVSSQFGPHCIEVHPNKIEEAIRKTAQESVYPYLQLVVRNWQQTGAVKQNGFGFAKMFKKLVHSGPPRPENNVFFDACRAMQPHVASIPAPRKTGTADYVFDTDLQLRRLADTAFMLGEYRLAHLAYDALRKPFTAEQMWAPLAACCEMAAVTAAMLHLGDVDTHSDTALYTYSSRLKLPVHYFRCVLLVCGCLVENGDQLLAAGLLSTALLEIDPVLGEGSEPAKTAMLMERVASAFGKRSWNRKQELWTKLAELEWARTESMGSAETVVRSAENAV